MKRASERRTAASTYALFAERGFALVRKTIARRLGMARSTVAAVLLRVGLSRLSLLEPPKPLPLRYERQRSGELVHLDVKPLGKIGVVGHRVHGDWRRRARGVGWEFVHVAIDDATRLAFVEILSDQKGLSAVEFFEQARRWFARQRICRFTYLFLSSLVSCSKSYMN
jgi:hypothetical protein